MTTTFSYDENLVSDIHKDTYGFRPSEIFWRQWEEADETGRQKIWDNLLIDHEIEMDSYRENQERAIREFEDRVIQVIQLGAGDRATAIRWILDGLDGASDDYLDIDYLEYHFDLPYGYIARTA